MEPEQVCPTYVGMNRIPVPAQRRAGVCPTYVGMNHQRMTADVIMRSMPHVCGDEPAAELLAGQIEQYAPRMWG